MATTAECLAAAGLKGKLGLTQTKKRFRQAKLGGRRPAKKPFINIRQRLARQAWVRNWVAYDFKDVIFTDEKKWVLVAKR